MPSLISEREREAALEAFRTTPAGRDKPSRFWKVDLEALAPAKDATPSGSVTFEGVDSRVSVFDLQTAQRDHAGLLQRAFRQAVEPRHKYAHLAQANLGLGAFVHVPAGAQIDEPIVVRYRAKSGDSIYPYTVVLCEANARVTIVERLELGQGAFACGVSEIVTEERASVTYAAAQFAPQDARVLFTRVARPGRDATVAWATAELGAAVSVCDLGVTIDHPGVDAQIATLFFPTGSQHVDIASSVDHRAGDATSNTLVKSAAAGSGQGRYLGSIRIAAHAQQSDASLRDDALLLSKSAHIDSIPALEIAANDVKAYHGATVGALDESAIFYMTSRGIDRIAAERMIALGFFEPAIDRFPTQALRDELRAALEEKVALQ